MGKEKFNFEEVNDDVIVYVDKYLKLLMTNVKYSFLENTPLMMMCFQIV